MVQQVKTFTHNGGTWTRPDIPSSVGQNWKCHVCQKSIDCEPEEYSVQQGVQLIRKLRWIPASRYWHGYTVGIEFCSADCSLKYYQEENASTS
jgi:hypothetical protein